MRDITEILNHTLTPVKALLIYKSDNDTGETYVESFDIDKTGKPVNAHPLAVDEAGAIARALDSSGELKRNYMCSKGILPKQVLFIDPSADGYVVWHTPVRQADLLFAHKLGIPNGRAHVPAMVWKANRENLILFALKNSSIPKESTTLYRAPFFNIYSDGRVCMGTVPIEVAQASSLQEFIATWEQYFFNSYFSHSMHDVFPVKGNIIQLWQNQVETGCRFPVNVLNSTKQTLKAIL